MPEKPTFEFDNYTFEKISFEEFCEKFRIMLADMRADEELFGFQDYFEGETNIDLSLYNIQEKDIFGILVIYENFLQRVFTNQQYELELQDGIVSVYQQTEVLPNKTQIPWFTVGIFHQELNETRKDLLVCKNIENDSVHYWSLSEAADSSPNNIPVEFRLVSEKLRSMPKSNS
jgi:hypothetical protein